MKKLPEVLIEIRQLIAQNELDLVFPKLFDFVFENRKGFLDDLILISKRYHKLKKEKLLGIISHEIADVQESKITYNILEFIQQLEKTNQIIFGTKRKSNGQVEILIEGELKDFNQTRKENLKSTVAAILNLNKEDVIIKRIMEGSIKIVIELPYDKNIELAALFNRDSSLIAKLTNEFQVNSINLIPFEKSLKNQFISSYPIQSEPVARIRRFKYSSNNFIESILEEEQSYITTAYEKKFKPAAIHYLRKNANEVLPLDANDFINDAFINLIDAIKRKKIEEPYKEGKITSYFIGIIKNIVRSHVTKKKRLKLEPLEIAKHSPVEKPEDLGFFGLTNTDFEDKWISVLNALNELKRPCKEIVLMRYYLGYHPSVIKERLNFGNENQVRQRSYNCLKSLRKIIETNQKRGIT